MVTGARVPQYRPKPTRQQRLAYGGVAFGAAAFLTVLTLQPQLVTQTVRQLTGMVREVPVASGPLPGTVLERLPHPQQPTGSQATSAASPSPASSAAASSSSSTGTATGGKGSHFVPAPPGPGHGPVTPPGSGHTAGPITGIIHPPVVIVADGVDQATGGASSPVTGPAVQNVDHVTGAVDGALGVGHGHGHASGHVKHESKHESKGKSKHEPKHESKGKSKHGSKHARHRH